MALLLHYTGQDYISRGLLKTELTPGSTSAIVGGCKTGKGFSFDGTNNSAYINMTSFDNTNIIAISTWFRTGVSIVVGENLTVFATSNNTRPQLIIEVFGTNRIGIGVLDSNNSYNVATTADNAVTPNVWHHLYAQINKTTRRLTLYLNGVLVQNKSYPSVTLQTSNRFYIGRRLDIVKPFNGQVCNFKLYNHVLSQKEIKEDYKSLMLHYKLDKPITTQVFDHS